MGTEVLRPHDVLSERFRLPATASFNRRRNIPANGNLTNLIVNKKSGGGYHSHNKRTSPKPDKKRAAAEARKPREAAVTRRKDDGGGVGSGSGHAMAQVTLLRRGESFDSLASTIKGGNGNTNPNPKPTRSAIPIQIQKPASDDLAFCGTGRIGPDSPGMVPRQIRVTGPPPPPDMYAGSAFSLSPSPRSLPLPSFFSKQHGGDTVATRDLRRMLRLD